MKLALGEGARCSNLGGALQTKSESKKKRLHYYFRSLSLFLFPSLFLSNNEIIYNHKIESAVSRTFCILYIDSILILHWIYWEIHDDIDCSKLLVGDVTQNNRMNASTSVIISSHSFLVQSISFLFCQQAIQCRLFHSTGCPICDLSHCSFYILFYHRYSSRLFCTFAANLFQDVFIKGILVYSIRVCQCRFYSALLTLMCVYYILINKINKSWFNFHWS